jgi:hypothetical protein
MGAGTRYAQWLGTGPHRGAFELGLIERKGVFCSSDFVWDSIKSGVRGLSSRQPPISKGDIIGARVKFSVCLPDVALKRPSIKGSINFAKVQL